MIMNVLNPFRFGPTNDAVNANGTDTRLDRDAALTGVSDGTGFAASLWVKGNASVKSIIMRSVGGAFGIIHDTDSTFNIKVDNPAGTATPVDLSTSGVISDGSWHNILVSFLLGTTSVAHIYLDDVSDKVTNALLNSETADFTDTDWGVLGKADGAGQWLATDAYDWWIDFNYIDFSVTANRRKFVTAAVAPVILGTTGEVPTGATPDIFFSGPTATWHRNEGTAGTFVEYGALTTASTTP